MLTDQQTFDPDVGVLDADKDHNYRLELIRTLSWCFRLNLVQNPDVAARVSPATFAKFKADMTTLTLGQLEDRLEALRVQNPGLVAEAMQSAGHNVTRDAEGNLRIGDPTLMVGRPVTQAEFEA